MGSWISAFSREPNIEIVGGTASNYSPEPNIEVLIKLVEAMPKSDWPRLEMVTWRFNEAVHEAWRTVKSIRVNKDLVTINELDEGDDASKIDAILNHLLARVPKLEAISGFTRKFTSRSDTDLIDDSTIELLCRFEHLKSIDFGSDKVNHIAATRFLGITQPCHAHETVRVDVG